MDIIHLLPDSVANQIAAGEVIQRPASVIKELVENAIDAGATEVQIAVEDAGKTSIQVIDNGSGMSETDARIAFERHATSKIREASDLFDLHTMGFRGEALPSIAAVAQVELRTRLKDQELGTLLRIEGSKIKEQEAIACPVGSNFIVRNLFFNIPVRRKFLKSNQTELSQILSEFERMALAHSDVAFKFFSNDTLLYELPIGSFRKRIVGLFGKRIDDHLLPVDVETDLVGISGFVGSPESTKKKGAHQFFFTNSRFMRHPYFARAVLSAYERLIPDGQQPDFFLNLKVDPKLIDVNIHPSKTEIKFQDEQSIWPIMLAATREAIAKYAGVPTLDFDAANRPDIPAFNPLDDNVERPQTPINPDFNPFKPTTTQTGGTHIYNNTRARVERPSEDWQEIYNRAFGLDANAPQQLELPTDGNAAAAPPSPEYLRLQGGRYILFASADGLVCVDAHRAHLRVLYEQYLEAIRTHNAPSQGLLFMPSIELSLSKAEMIEPHLPMLKAVGFDLERDGRTTFSLRSIPEGTERLDPARLLQDMLDQLLTDASTALSQPAATIAAALAKKVAVDEHTPLSQPECAKLIEQLFATENPNRTPDGKVVFATIPLGTIEKLF